MLNNYNNSLIPPDNETFKGSKNNTDSYQYNIAENEMTFQYDSARNDIICGCIGPYSVFTILLTIITVVLTIYKFTPYSYMFGTFALVIIIIMLLVNIDKNQKPSYLSFLISPSL